jgi:outer membrane receptor protein involved in Fe transport
MAAFHCASVTILLVRLILGGLVSLLFSGFVYGQTITGLVVDQTGAAVPGARISLIHTARVHTTTDTEGRFSLSAPIIDGMRLTVMAQGFARFERSLANDGVRDFTIVLQPAEVTGDVTVSITRIPTRLAETPASVVALDRETLETTAAQTTDDALRQIAGFSLFRRSSSKTSNPTTQGANLRGLAGSGASRASVLLDGSSLNDAFGGWTYWSRVPRVAVEKIEVLRGGASSLYGTSALSGAINIETGPSEDGPTLRVETSGGTQSTFDGGIFGSYSRSKWSIDVAAEAFQTAGYIPAAKDERGFVDSKANSRHGNGLVTIQRSFGSQPSNRVFVRGNLFGERRDNGTRLTNNRTYFRQVAGGADLANTRLGTFQLRSFIETQVYDQTFSAISNNRNTETLSRIQRVPSQGTGASLVWSRPLRQHLLTGGVEYREVRGFSDETVFANGIATSLVGSGGRERTVSAFVQDAWQLAARLNVHVGARYDRWTNFAALSATRNMSTGITTTTVFPDRTENSFSPRVAAIYEVDTNLSIFASYNRSFRAPTLNELYRAFRVGNVLTLANANLDAERADTFESGLNYSVLKRRVWLRGNFFYAAVSDPVVSVTLSTTPSLITRQRQNVGRTRAAGVEFDAEFRLRPDLKLSAGYLFVDSRVSAFPASPNLIGNFVPQVARQQMTFQAVYSPSRLSIALQGRTAGRRFEDDLNSLKLRPYFTGDVFASYRLTEKVQIFTAVENIFDTRYDIGLTPNLTVAAPRAVRAGLRFDLSKR